MNKLWLPLVHPFLLPPKAIWRCLFFGMCALFFCINIPLAAQDEAVQRDILKYGTDNEIAELIKTLKKTSASYLDDEFIGLARTTKNIIIKSQVIGFFSEREKPGLENNALDLLQKREELDGAHVLTAIEYLGKVKYSGAHDTLREMLEDGDERWNAAILKALGRLADTPGAGKDASFFINYYENKNPSEQEQRELVLALGKIGSDKAITFLSELINENTRSGLVIAALTAAADAGGPVMEESVMSAVSFKDPNIRASAVETLGRFESEAAKQAILDAFRDSYYKTRLAAIKAAGAHKFKEAVFYLKFRAERDEVPAVQEEAVRSLGAIGNAECTTIIETLFDDKKTSDRLKSTAALMLINLNADAYAAKIITRLDEAKRLNQKQLYNGLAAALSKAQTAQVKSLAGRLFASKDAGDKAFALELTSVNRFREYTPEVRRLADENSSGLSRKAHEVLKNFGEI